MQIIRQLHDVVRQYVSRRDPALKYVFQEGNNATELLEGVVSGVYKTDEDAVLDLYSLSKNDKLRYRQTKHTVIRKLESLFFFLNFRTATHSAYTANLYKVKREVFVGDVLSWLGRHEAMVQTVTRALKTAEDYEFTLHRLRCYQLLQKYYSKIGNRQEYMKHSEAVTHTLAVYNAEIRAVTWRTRMRLEAVSQSVVPQSTLREFREILPIIEADVKTFKTRTLYANFVTFAGATKRLLGEFAEAANIYEDYLQFLDDNPAFDMNSQRGMAHYSLARSFHFLRDYEKALKHTDKAFEYVKLRSENWYSVAEMGLFIALHSQNYRKAIDTFQWVLNQANFSDSAIRLEKWSIYEAYLRFLVEDEESFPSHQTVRGSQFSLNYILEEIDVVRTDRIGMYLSILVFQIVHYVKKRLLNLVESRLRTLKYYVYPAQQSKASLGRYYRTQCFVQMLSVMVQCEYHPSDTKQKAEPLYRQLLEYKQDDTADESPMALEEIVPYQHLWDFVLRELKTIEAEGVFIRATS